MQYYLVCEYYISLCPALFFIKFRGHGTHVDSPYCSGNNSTRVHQCKAVCDNSDLMKYLDAPQVMPTLSQVMSYSSFWMFLCLMLVSWAFFASTVTLSDTVCFMLLGELLPNRVKTDLIFQIL